MTSPVFDLVTPAPAAIESPLDLLYACHRRIEQRLALLPRISSAVLGDDPAERAKVPEAITFVTSYFQQGMPRHVADEDCDLFPILRRADAELAEVIGSLEIDHRGLEFVHNEMDSVLTSLLYHPVPAAARRLVELAAYVTPLYERHIKTEDEVVFPRAREILTAEQTTTLARIYRARRGL